jgi:hypothetical protein
MEAITRLSTDCDLSVLVWVVSAAAAATAAEEAESFSWRCSSKIAFPSLLISTPATEPGPLSDELNKGGRNGGAPGRRPLVPPEGGTCEEELVSTDAPGTSE